MKKITAIVFLALIFSLVSALSVGAGTCRLVSGKSYYSDGIGFFEDAACRTEIDISKSDEESSGGSDPVTIIATGWGNCRYNTAKRLYTDGTDYFLDEKCRTDAGAGETAPAPTAASSVKPVAKSTARTISKAGQTAAKAVSSADFAEMSRRITALEKRIIAMQSTLAQILELLTKTDE